MKRFDERKIFKVTALAAAMAMTYPLAVTAEPVEEEAESAQAQEPQAGQHTGMREDRLQELREKTVSAEELLNANVNNLGNPVGNVSDLVLNEEGTAVQYVLYEIPYPYVYLGAQNGFVAFENLEVSPADAGFGNHVSFSGEVSDEAPEELEITRTEADHRLVSNILDSTISFSDGEVARDVEDILIDRQTGEITGYVVNTDPDAWFNDDPRVVAADQVQIGDQGEVSTQAEFAALETIE